MKIIYILLFVTILTNSYGQDVKIPLNFNPKTAEDYAPYKDSVQIAAKFLINTPLNQNSKTRDAATKFMFRWVSGAPYTHIEIKPEFTNDLLVKENPYSSGLFMNYVAGMLLTKLETPAREEIVAQQSGVSALVKGYSSIRTDQKNKVLEKLLKLYNKGELNIWVTENNKTYSEANKKKSYLKIKKISHSIKMAC